MGCLKLPYYEKEDLSFFQGLWKKSDSSKKSYKYYPFGLQTSTSWTRDNSKNDFLYNAGSELNANSGWYEMFYRGYDPALGRMMQVDPYASSYASHNPYNYGLNNPVLINDPSGGLSQAQVNSAARSVSSSSRHLAGIYESWGQDWNGGMYFGSQNIEGSQSFGEAMSHYLGEGSGYQTFVEVIISKMYLFKDLVLSKPFDVSTEWMTLEQALEEGVFGSQSKFVQLDLNGNITRFDQGGNLIFVDTGDGKLALFHHRLVRGGTMSPKAFANGLRSILEGMHLPEGKTFNSQNLWMGEISLAIYNGRDKDGKSQFIVYNDGSYVGQANTIPTLDGVSRDSRGFYKVTYCDLVGNGPNATLTVDRIRMIMGYHEYFAHGVKGLIHQLHHEEIMRIQNMYPQY